MRRMTWIAAIILSMALVLSACGTKDAESVVKDLDKFLNSMEGYSGTGTMTLHNGQQPQVYQVEVSYSKPEAYRIKLTNAEKDISQIVLRNDEGVFVLTPKQNKVFRFQSDWPQKQGQVYLYQTLIQSILLDGSRQFTTTDDAYVFDVMAKYNSTSLARQKIWLSQDDYKPMQVEVSDTNATVLVDVKFDTFEFNPSFAESFFETESNMQTSSDNVDTLAPGDEGVGAEEGNVDSDTSTDPDAGTSVEQPTAGEEGQETEQIEEDDATSIAPTTPLVFTAMEALHVPSGVTFKDMTDIEYAGDQGVMTRYQGAYNYTLIQTEAKELATTLVPGDFVDLGFTIAQLTSGDDVHTLTWTYYGNQFRLSSADLPEVEMIKIAQSVLAEVSK
ncbi:MAG: outer membrane lipoprotein carrier protein LolA [Candidatus Pristimantibacillus lignocellulolyticus]|uniref:Outer membrane lipoprotein carrier protein LolA n=1 Tax=Candidatus Pristimantibacillus lignocellulolyticus TaxID=2994561 RepID=A0A9J6Z8T2_9BACL|nr:MAG: outer membrane lipoprotein carrier protein LolA [Candidatus Pristimantibacillus lignocellulolyticus]